MGPIVVVHWNDAWSTTNVPESPGTPVQLVCVGFLESENEHGVTIVAEYYAEFPKDGRHFRFIPWVGVTKMEVLEDV